MPRPCTVWWPTGARATPPLPEPRAVLPRRITARELFEQQRDRLARALRNRAVDRG